ncbi:MAG: hypothetical protein ACUVT3_11130 [Ignavibacterium sp.]
MDKNKPDLHSFDDLNDIEKIKYTKMVWEYAGELIKDDKAMIKLNRYTSKIIFKYTKHHSINGKEAKDFIQDALLSTAEGKRFFRGSNKKDLLNHLYYIIPSIISNELKKVKIGLEVQTESGKEKMYQDKFISIDEMMENYNNDDDDDKPGFELASKDSSILDRIIFQEELNDVERFIYSELEKNDDIISIYLYEAKINGIKNPHKHVAEQLNVPVEEVRNAAKRLDRTINKAMRYYNEG